MTFCVTVDERPVVLDYHCFVLGCTFISKTDKSSEVKYCLGGSDGVKVVVRLF